MGERGLDSSRPANRNAGMRATFGTGGLNSGIAAHRVLLLRAIGVNDDEAEKMGLGRSDLSLSAMLSTHKTLSDAEQSGAHRSPPLCGAWQMWFQPPDILPVLSCDFQAGREVAWALA
ncbi:hypothetical protein EYF80_039267 [Liparis tanakae]|uniref:Uncharacterized protein n=1 Tax=Liparis tanakae TaxID=230148 RepID=A0A4Z2GAH5_9TELE|nr:hypothetical protein EYF80_039267 [Liparis tanakae]